MMNFDDLLTASKTISWSYTVEKGNKWLRCRKATKAKQQNSPKERMKALSWRSNFGKAKSEQHQTNPLQLQEQLLIIILTQIWKYRCNTIWFWIKCTVRQKSTALPELDSSRSTWLFWSILASSLKSLQIMLSTLLKSRLLFRVI